MSDGLNAGLRAYQAERNLQRLENEAAVLEARTKWKAGAADRARAAQRARNSKRRALERRQLAGWANLDAIKAIYQRAIDLTRATGIPHHVDHAIPLAGKLVSGLHVENNLEVMTALENMKKHNQFEVGNG